MTARVLFLQHQDDCGPGYLGDRALERGLWVEVADLARGGPPDDPTRYDLLVSLGSQYSVLDPTAAFLPRERAFLERAVGADVPVLGVCFGAQLLASVLGARVRPLERPEIGWFRVDTAAPDLVGPGPWLLWHLDTFDCPPGAEQLASTECAVQAFQQGPHLGVQFHPEATPESAASWAAATASTLAAEGIDRAALLDETQRRRPEARDRAATLLDRVVDGLR